ncbi:hypothetical protein GCM10027093_21430 [Paraburkholderia jirisanensis]
MAYTVRFNAQFAKEFANFPSDQQDAILDFTDTFEKYGLGDFTRYVGKITPSWNGVAVGGPQYTFAYTNDLWHYHIGLPKFNHVHGKYATSDWVLHFQWPSRGTTINLVDICYHYTSTGAFYVPGQKYLDPASSDDTTTGASSPSV